MTRTGSIFAGTLAFALAVVAALLLTGAIGPDLLGLNPFASRFSEKELNKFMSEVAFTGGVGATFADKDLPNWRLGIGHRLERYSLTGAEAVMARLISSERLDAKSVDWYSTTASFTLPIEFAQQSSGKKIEVGIIARSAAANGSPTLSVAYATQQAGNSGWKAIPLTTQFELTKFTYDVPALAQGYTNKPVIAFHSDAEGSGRAVEILGAYARQVRDN